MMQQRNFFRSLALAVCGLGALDASAMQVKNTGGIGTTPNGVPGQRQTSEFASSSFRPMDRLDTRIDNRVQSRIRNRLDGNYASPANPASSYERAVQQAQSALAPD